MCFYAHQVLRLQLKFHLITPPANVNYTLKLKTQMLPEQENKSDTTDTSGWKEINHGTDMVLLVNQLNIILKRLFK